MPKKSEISPQSLQTDASNTIPRRSLHEDIAVRLRNEIVEGIWLPGTRLQERILCERYGVSRSPLRETFQIMVKEGLLELLPGRGAIVTRSTLTDALECAEVVTNLETLAIDLACERATDQHLEEINDLHIGMQQCNKQHDIKAYYEVNNAVHRAIVAASCNAALISVHENVQRHITRLQNLSGALEETTDESFEEHEEFIKALQERNAKRATATLKIHLMSTIEKIKKRIFDSNNA